MPFLCLTSSIADKEVRFSRLVTAKFHTAKTLNTVMQIKSFTGSENVPPVSRLVLSREMIRKYERGSYFLVGEPSNLKPTTT